MFRRVFISLACMILPSAIRAEIAPQSRIIVSVRDQKLMVVENGARISTYPVSTSKFGVGDNWGRMTTPLGFLKVVEKIGDHAPTGAVFHNRRFTGEIIKPNAPGRDPIITRIIWLSGLEPANAHAFSRCIYIHGTPQEKLIGRPASYGCIRMKSSDVTELYDHVPLGAVVEIVADKLPKVPKAPRVTTAVTSPAKLEIQNAIAPKETPKPAAEKPAPENWRQNAGSHPHREHDA